MRMPRILLLCLLALTLGLMGPLARGFSSKISPDPLTIEATRTGVTANSNGSATASKSCQRGVLGWSSCSFEIGYVPRPLQIDIAFASHAFGRNVGGSVDDLQSSRLFRPPRLS